jgi:enolase 1/2/3
MGAFDITDVQAMEIIDNRGMPTIRVSIQVGDRYRGTADVPCGSSTGSYEAVELRDGGDRYGGKGVRQAIDNIHSRIAPRILGRDATGQRHIDALLVELDGTPDKSDLGANAILGVSLALAKAAANALNLPLYRYLNTHGHVLPVPQACLINGGLHAGNDLDIQEFCVMPVGAANFREAVRMLSEIFYVLKDLLQSKLGKIATNTSEDGGFAPPLEHTAEALDFLIRAADQTGYGDRVCYGLDVAATGLYDHDTQRYTFEGARRSSAEMQAFYHDLLNAYPGVVSLEDPLHENDLAGMAALTEMFADRLMIGDDVFATNIGRLQQGLAAGAGNAMLCKVNQVGTLTEAMDAARYARHRNWAVVMSVRSGETEDSILSDVSVALNAGLFKTGGMRGSDRGTNYNRFMEIEAELGLTARYAGRDYAKP